ncbi:unnamed protein product [Trichobilharzia szidati]|nr:unnamed protein product [Trichobilharzia szidati]
MNNTPGCQDPVTKRKDEVLSTDDPTEYRDFKLPGSKRRDKSLTLSTPNNNNNNNNNKPQFYSPASRRSSNKSFKIWSDIYAENLRKADNNLTALQDKVRKSLLTDDDKLITPEVINDSAATKCKCNSRRQLQDSPVKIGKSFSSLDLLNTDKKADRIFYEKYGVLASDVKKFKDYCDDEDILCPEVGLSPTEIKGHLTSGDQGNVESPVMNCKTNSSIPSASNVVPHTEVNVKNATKSNYESQSPNQNISKPNNNKGFVNLSECISHLIEERSRIQGKLFRLKLLYKTYKRRLDNLDSSLLALQKQTNIDPSDDGLSPSKTGKPSYPNSNDCADKANNTSISHQSPTADKQLPVTPQIPMTKKVVVTTKSSINQKREDKSTQSPAALSSSLSPASLPNCHHHHQHHQHSNIWQTTRRSMSVPRSPLPLNHCRNSTSTTAGAAAATNHFLHDNISKTSQDLAVSLASIDLQLHHVLNHLDSSITPNHQLPVKNYSCSECECCCCCSVSARNDNATEQSPCLHVHEREREDEENIQQIEQCLENIDLNDTTPPLLLGGCTSSNLSCLPSCSCWKSQCKSQSSNRTMELFSSPTNRLLNSYSVGVDYNELESVRASLGSLLKSARKPNNTLHSQTPCKNNNSNNKDSNDNHNSDSPYKCK